MTRSVVRFRRHEPFSDYPYRVWMRQCREFCRRFGHAKLATRGFRTRFAFCPRCDEAVPAPKSEGVAIIIRKGAS